jgi:PKD repeat protein
MNKEGLRIILFFVLVIFFLNFISASFEFGNPTHFFDKNYGPFENLNGWINMSFNEESINSIFLDSFGNSISLIELLKKNNNYFYSCDTKNCISDYLTTNKSLIKNFSLKVGDSKILGFKLEEDLKSIDSISFLVESNAEKSCYNQLSFDFLNDYSIDFSNEKFLLEEGCSFLKNYGCFSGDVDSSEYIIGKFPNKHCQKVFLSESPAFELGAWIKRDGDQREIIAEIYNLDGSSVEDGSCVLSDINEEEFSCLVNYSLSDSKEYYVCIYSNEEGISKIKGYYLLDGCGFYGTSIQSENAAFKIFAEGKKFDNFGILNITNSLNNDNSLGVFAEDYIIEKYGSLNCLAKGCIVPFKLTSQKQQDITISNLEFKYESNFGQTISNYFYDLEEVPAKVNSDFQKLFLDKGNFILPFDYGNKSFKLNFSNREILSENLIIEKVPIIKSFFPTKIASVYPTIFNIKVDSSSPILSYEWIFGDNETIITSDNNVKHAYSLNGNYKLKVIVTDSNQRISSKIFDITVESPKKMINATLSEIKDDLNKLEKEFNELSFFYKKSLEETLELGLLNDKLKQLQRDYNSVVLEEDYIPIVEDILELRIPKEVYISKNTSNLVFYPEKENVNLGILETIEGKDYEIEDEENYIEGVFMWNKKNLDTNVKFIEFSVKYKDSLEEPLLRFFELNMIKKDSSVRDPYFILENLENLKFEENYLELESSGYIYIILTGKNKKILFSTTEDVDFINLPLFISPEIARLPLIEVVIEDEEPKKWKLFIAILFLLLIILMISYIILAEWYKRKYESSLFKNPNSLYNLLIFIKIARGKGEDYKKIRLRLRKAGWNSEQIIYAIKKYSGKRTGMFELPFIKFLEIFKKKNSQNKEINKKNFIRKRLNI